MKLYFPAALVLSLALPLPAAPQWPTVEPYLPDKAGALVVLNVDKDARETLSTALPLDSAIVQKVLDEHFGAFAARSGIKVMEISNVFGGLSVSAGPNAPGVLGIRVPLDLALVARTLKSTVSPQEIKEAPGQIVFQRGATTWAFLKEGLVLLGRPESLELILKRKGGSPSNTAFVNSAKARGAAATNLFLMATLPPGLLPPLPDNVVVSKLGIDPQLTTHLTGLVVTSSAEGLSMTAEFDDSGSATKLTGVYTALLKTWQEKATADLAAAETKAASLGALGHFHPDLVSGRMGVEFAAYVGKAISVKADGKAAMMMVPRELLRAFKGGGTIMVLGVAAAMAAPAIKAAQAAAQGGVR